MKPGHLVIALLLGALPAGASAADANSLLQLVDYVGVDYPAAVQDGEVISEFEYAEMAEFADRIREGIGGLPASAGKDSLLQRADALDAKIASKAPPAEISAITRELRDGLMRHYPVSLVPRRAPDLARAETLYQQNCVSCHGVEGRGDGPVAPGMEPAPTDFHDDERARQRSLFGLYNTITLGVDGTPMTAFQHLSDTERWALAFYVGGMHVSEERLLARAAAWDDGAVSMQDAVTRSLSELEGSTAAKAAWVRHNPEALFAGGPDPLQVAQINLADSAEAYAAGDAKRAQSLAVTSYLEGFELVEASLRNVAPSLMFEVEDAMIAYRGSISDGAPVAEVSQQAEDIALMLDEVEKVLSEGTLSPWVSFMSSLIILLREGLEAILILGAIAAFLIKTEKRESLPYMHFGWVGALAAGLATWVAATWFIDISGAAREVTEGFTALIAAGVLFYVGFWMHDKISAQRWNQFIKEKIQKALDQRTLWGITFIAFIAVYREAFETVLFYQALWAQVDATGHSMVLAGAGVAALALLIIGWGIFRFGLRLPLKQFFGISAAVMFVLAVIFAGKGVVALQEAGHLPIHPVAFPRIELLGIYPNLQSLMLQFALAVIAIGLVWWGRRESPQAA